MQILLLRLFHETNTFDPGVTEAECFQKRHGLKPMQEAPYGSIIHGLIELAKKSSVEIVPCFDFGTKQVPVASDQVVNDAFECIDELLPEKIAKILVGLFSILHGAMVSQSHDDVEGIVLKRIQQLIGNLRIPVAAVLDLHANVSPQIANHLNILVAYIKKTHTDALLTAIHCIRIFFHNIKNNLKSRICFLQFLWPLSPSMTATKEEPMAELLEIASRHESSRIKCKSIAMTAPELVKKLASMRAGSDCALILDSPSNSNFLFI